MTGVMFDVHGDVFYIDEEGNLACQYSYKNEVVVSNEYIKEFHQWLGEKL